MMLKRETVIKSVLQGKQYFLEINKINFQAFVVSKSSFIGPVSSSAVNEHVVHVGVSNLVGSGDRGGGR